MSQFHKQKVYLLQKNILGFWIEATGSAASEKSERHNIATHASNGAVAARKEATRANINNTLKRRIGVTQVTPVLLLFSPYLEHNNYIIVQLIHMEVKSHE